MSVLLKTLLCRLYEVSRPVKSLLKHISTPHTHPSSAESSTIPTHDGPIYKVSVYLVRKHILINLK